MGGALPRPRALIPATYPWLAVGVRLECEDCGAGSVSSLFYRGPARHRCQRCGGQLALADPTEDRRTDAEDAEDVAADGFDDSREQRRRGERRERRGATL